MRCRYYFVFAFVSLSVADITIDCNDPNWHSLETLGSAKSHCGPAFEGRCYCHRTCYDGHHEFVVNCTNSGFKNTIPLAQLPNETQVLIFTGNDLGELPWNVFGTLDRLPYLKVIDMSNNNIREIRGKAYHHVKQVERLMLNFNKLSLDPERNHPRVFSNFVSLLSLHLTDAFEDGPPRDLAATLHDIFVNSDLTRLIKLHLEQNEISEFRDPNVFCDLPNLMDLHLGDNNLTALHFNLTCLGKLRFLDLQKNRFTRVLERDLRTLDDFVSRSNRTVAVDLSGNPFECNCRLNPFIQWMKRTKIYLRNNASMLCNEGAYEHYAANHETHKIHESSGCPSKLLSSSSSTERGTTILLYLLSVLLIVLLCALFYVQREQLQKKIQPVLETVNKKVRYTSIGNAETREDV